LSVVPVPNKRDFWFRLAYNRIPQIVRECKLVTDREIKVRLEGGAFPGPPGPPGPFPWVTGYALNALLKDKILKTYGYVGRRKIKGGVTNKFYCLYNTSYSDVEGLIQQKSV